MLPMRNHAPSSAGWRLRAMRILKIKPVRIVAKLPANRMAPLRRTRI